MEEVDEQELQVERVAALDLGKAALEACVRHETKPGRRLQAVGGDATTTGSLLALADWLHSWGVTRVVMESTSNYWKGVFWLLEADGFDCWLAGARDARERPRAAQDRQGRCGLAGRGGRAGQVPALAGAAQADPGGCGTPARYRRALTQDRTRQLQRVEQLLQGRPEQA